MKSIFIAGATGALLTMAALAAVSAAEPAAKEMQSPQGIIEKLEKEGGRVTDFELDRDFGRDIYEIELVDKDGREWDIEVDAHTGEVLNRREDRD
jgi:uncharacterized membrane protein YkoI